MMVTFVSQCEKNALKKTRRVLDAFANRIGDNTWQTLITEEGLLTVKKMLGQTATRSTAVSCHWIRSRSRSQLLWVVGNKKKFNVEGVVPVNSTEKDLLNSDYESDWKYLPLIKALAGMAALLHDWGKASLLFQEKLNPEIKNKYRGDPLRHEWISCLLFHQFVANPIHQPQDEAWLATLINQGIDESCFKTNRLPREKALAELPTAAALIAWLIVSHHRLPLPKEKELCDRQREVDNASLADLLARITPAWGYENRFDEYNMLLPKCFEFPLGLLSNSSIWLADLKRRAKDLLHHLPLLDQAMNDGSWRGILHHARLCLMLGDHYYSSQPNDHQWQTSTELYANTDPATKARKQKLDEHLVNVAKVAVNTVKLLPFFETEPLKATKLSELAPKANTPKAFRWQDKAVRKINEWREHTEDKSQGYFLVNMASTGCGKTIANAKVMQALSDDGESLRFILALGLRTLTLQTGDEYKERLKLQESDLAVLIGSKAISELHKSGKKVEKDDIEPEQAEAGSESLESLQDENDILDWQGVLPEEELTTVLTKEKNRKLLYAPVLVCTIDHIMAATETKRGGRYILPCLRLMSSDLVIDEIDDFTGDDLIAIGRLVHLAGMLGRKVMISSATIPPDLALGLYNAYRQGWAVFAASRDRVSTINCVYVDEFSTDTQMVGCDDPDLAVYEAFQQCFVAKRVDKLKQQISRRKAEIIPCIKQGEQPLEEEYFEIVKQAVLTKHQHHNTIEPESQTRVSFGVVRVANIQPCVELTQYLLSCDWPADTEVRCMAYHSQQVMLLRHAQEKHLDEVLKRKEKPEELPIAFAHPLIREHVTACQAQNLIFILVATPVEEVGRDHDFDWAVIEPSSFRSIIQMAGRVRRHRDGEIQEPNIGLLQYNVKGFKGGSDRVFNHPGYETDSATQLATHDLSVLVDKKLLLQSVNAIVRIQKRAVLEPRNNLADLEHFATAKTLGTDQIGKPQQANISRQDRYNRNCRSSSPQSCWYEHLHGHIHGYWWLTALPQHFKRFRKSEPTVQIYLVKKARSIEFCLREEQGGLHPIERTLNIEHLPLAPEQEQKLWLQRDYSELVSFYSPNPEQEFATSVRYGEISFACHEGIQQYSYNDQLGLVKVK
ncbi:type I-F CRISPR-associated helicase Cas3f [bacterium 19MO03SA05]|uniref:Type I-F CRISPR-associated helicase Cas3f n=1 Tax=bacterium 19MO03SA05 TaxID=2920620 RepID=A0AAU6VGW3_UNCXX|nr:MULTISPECIES: type I-F CRISPR-associated helicase Cas3f [unclassified Vibrio]EKO3922426.1 type I-F CRISPR-associated helicase Cas3 [Vibrio metschnikovii]MDQ2107675.1 type I-F CRISPR-associated helicase Cas3 [Vibrio sp. 2017_1457_15]MDQ2160793.1 type I-F CRISPR-associated helicase Cas3 [Vibrio sp. 2017_1457_13]